MKIIYQKTTYDGKVRTYQISAETELSFIARPILEWDNNKIADYETAFSKSSQNKSWFFSLEELKEELQKEKAEKIAEIEKKYAV